MSFASAEFCLFHLLSLKHCCLMPCSSGASCFVVFRVESSVVVHSSCAQQNVQCSKQHIFIFSSKKETVRETGAAPQD